MAHVLLAIKPRFAELIFSHRKRVEVRRGGTSIRSGDTLVVYQSSPQREICGICTITDVVTRAMPSALSDVNGETGLSKRELQDYLEGASKATLLTLKTPTRLRRAIPLKELRRLLNNGTIPQSYRFLSEAEIERLTDHLRR